MNGGRLPSVRALNDLIGGVVDVLDDRLAIRREVRRPSADLRDSKISGVLGELLLELHRIDVDRTALAHGGLRAADERMLARMKRESPATLTTMRVITGSTR